MIFTEYGKLMQRECGESFIIQCWNLPASVTFFDNIAVTQAIYASGTVCKPTCPSAALNHIHIKTALLLTIPPPSHLHIFLYI